MSVIDLITVLGFREKFELQDTEMTARALEK